ncbi:peptidoglycan DD-metalloendopeptidase family protein [Arthrobacter sp. USHLN218]|uniref:peptidoglycan DD-metalloendopeptidase family protein n=1 Tax=Arthrobacter sp. USHLN218 TaxID=3081232 RepID=UPI0030187E51
MPVIGIAELLVQPSFKGVQQKVSRELDKTMPKAGRAAGQKLGKGMADAFSAETAGLEAEVGKLAKSVADAEKNVSASKAKLAAASAAEAKATGDLRVAEMKLQEVRDNKAAKASQIAAAEEKVEAVLVRSVAATERREAAEASLAGTTRNLGKAQADASRASADLEKHMKRVEEESAKSDRGIRRLGTTLSNAFHSSPLSGLADLMRRDGDKIRLDLHKLANDVSQQGTRGGRAFTQGFILSIGGLSAITPAIGALSGSAVAAAGAVVALASSLSQLGGLAALAPAGLMAAAAGAGVLATAFHGVGDAMKAFLDETGQAAANPRLAAMAVEDAAAAIRTAEENAARATENAARRVSDAKRNLQDTIESVAEAEENAARAQEMAARRVQDAKRNVQDAVEAVAEAEKAAAQVQVEAARRVKEAKQSLQDTIADVADAQRKAARSVELAERKEAEAAKEVVAAQKALVEAREKAAARVAEVGKKLDAANLKATDSTLALQRAQEAYAKAKADPKAGAMQLAQLQNNMAKAAAADEQAKAAVLNLRDEQKVAQAEAKAGNAAVLAAEEKLAKARQTAADRVYDRQQAEAEAVRRQKEGAQQIAKAQQAVTDAIADQKKAHADAAKAARDGARRVADAERDVKDAVDAQRRAHQDTAKAAKDGARQIADAQQAVKDAARDAEQAQTDAARSVEQAHRNLERVQLQQADAAAKASEKSSEAMGKLSPNAQAATRALLGVYDQLGRIRHIVQENFFAGFVGPLMSLAGTVMPQLATGAGAIASAFGSGFQQTMNSLNTAFAGGVLEGLLMGVAETVTILNKAIDPLVQAFVTLGVVGMEYMPRLATWIAELATQFNNFIQGASADGSLNAWIEAGIQGLKDIGSIISSVVGIFSALNDAAAAGGIVITLGSLADGLRNVETVMQGEVFQKTMGTIFGGAAASAQGLLAAVEPIGKAFERGAPALAEFLRLGGEIAGTFIGGIATALSDPNFGAGLNTFMEHLQAGVEKIAPLLPGLTGAFGNLLAELGPIVERLGPSLIEVFTGFSEAIGFVLGVFSPLLELLAGSPVLLGLLIAGFTGTAAASAALTAAGNVQRIMMGAWVFAAGLVKGALLVLRAQWLRTAAAAVISGAQTAYVWALYRIDALKSAAVHVAQAARVVGGWVAMQVAAGISGAKTAAVWTASVVRSAVVGAVQFGLQVGRVVAGWALMGVQSLLHAAKMAAAWFIALGPVGWVIAAVIGLVALIIANWDTVKRVTLDIFSKVSKFLSDTWTNIKRSVTDAFTYVTKWIQARLLWVQAVWNLGWALIRNKVSEIWNGIKTKIVEVFTSVASWINTKIEWVKTIWSLGWGAVKSKVSDIWGGIRSVIRDTWNNKIKPVIDAVITFVREKIPNAFEKAVEAAGKIFSGLQQLAAKPINFVIDTVYNKGLRKAINAVRKIVGGDPLPELDKVTWGQKAVGSGSKGPMRAFAKGGFAAPGWALVGEEGPELVNFSQPGRVYTATETQKALGAGHGPAKGLPAMGGWAADAWDAIKAGARKATEWVRGGLASAAEFLLNPIKKGLGALLPDTGLGDLAKRASSQVIDGALDWIRGKDKETMPTGSTAALFDGPLGSFHRPSRGPYTSFFGPRPGFGDYHTGVDIAGGGPTFAALNGIVSQIGNDPVGGIFIRLNHGKGFTTYYGHNPVGGPKVKVGQQVKAGQTIGQQGMTGLATGIHVHFQTEKNGRPTDPMAYLHDNGGVLRPGLSMILNKTRKPEAILNGRQWADIHKLALSRNTPAAGGPSLVVQGDVLGASAHQIVDVLETKRRREMTMANLRPSGMGF